MPWDCNTVSWQQPHNKTLPGTSTLKQLWPPCLPNVDPNHPPAPVFAELVASFVVRGRRAVTPGVCRWPARTDPEDLGDAGARYGAGGRGGGACVARSCGAGRLIR